MFLAWGLQEPALRSSRGPAGWRVDLVGGWRPPVPATWDPLQGSLSLLPAWLWLPQSPVQEGGEGPQPPTPWPGKPHTASLAPSWGLRRSVPVSTEGVHGHECQEAGAHVVPRGLSNWEAAAGTTFCPLPPPVVSLLGSVRSCQDFSFPVAAHASAECHFSPEALAAVGKDGGSSLRLIS